LSNRRSVKTPKIRRGEGRPEARVVVIPVSDVDRAKRFYESLGWRLDAISPRERLALVADEPSRSPCSSISAGITRRTGSVGTVPRVSDIEAAARAHARGNVSEVFHFDRVLADPRGRDPNTILRPYATFSDPDGNSWMLPGGSRRGPGRGFSSMDVATLTQLCRAEKHHGDYESTAPSTTGRIGTPPTSSRAQQGRTPEEAAKDGAVHMQQIRR
jgi:catechol 2,3-dioxygenase-like lactoylglutathione lyase family enzyme